MGGNLTRRPGWEGRLSAYVIGCMGKPFAWGTLDCATFAAGAVEALSGEDIAAPFRGYTTELGGMRKARAAGYADHEAIFADRLRPVPLSLLCEGDVVAVEQEGRVGMAVVSGAIVYAMTVDGFGVLPLSDAVRGYAV